MSSIFVKKVPISGYIYLAGGFLKTRLKQKMFRAIMKVQEIIRNIKPLGFMLIIRPHLSLAPGNLDQYTQKGK